jgi:hypothetical protein
MVDGIRELNMKASVSQSIAVDSKALSLPRFVIFDGTLECLKWLALIVMTIVHIDKYLYHQSLPGVLELGRFVSPLFCFVLAYNLARPDTLKSGRYLRTLKRLAFFGLIASLFIIPLSGQLKGCFPSSGLLKGAYPLNIMFLLLLATGIFYLIDTGGRLRTFAAICLFVFGGLFVEYWWFGIAFCFCAWLYCKSPSVLRLACWITAAASLYVVNRNYWAMAAIPIIFLAPRIQLDIPRIKYAFYIYYPAHLAVILAVSLFLKVY